MHNPSRSSHYSQLQPEDRVTIASLKQQNFSVRAIARQLLRSPATIGRELVRNGHPSGHPSDYGSVKAQSLCLQPRRAGRGPQSSCTLTPSCGPWWAICCGFTGRPSRLP
jgi:IS30 family transposase